MQVPGLDYEELILQIVTCTGVLGCAFGRCTGSSNLYAMLCILQIDGTRKLGTVAICRAHAPNRATKRNYTIPQKIMIFHFGQNIQNEVQDRIIAGNGNLTALRKTY